MDSVIISVSNLAGGIYLSCLLTSFCFFVVVFVLFCFVCLFVCFVFVCFCFFLLFCFFIIIIIM